MNALHSAHHTRSRRYYVVLIVLVLFALLFPQTSAAAETVGKVQFTKGTVAAQLEGEPTRLLGKESAVFLKDNIQTGEASFAVLVFDDGARLSVRPNSSLSVASYRLGENGEARLQLHKGGVRAATGDLAKQSADSFQIAAGAATLKAQQAEYSVRLCKDDCQSEQVATLSGAQAKPVARKVIARAVAVEGEVKAQTLFSPGAPVRSLRVGSSLYRNDQIRSDIASNAVLVFTDKSRLSVHADTVFDVNAYFYQEQGQDDQARFTLVKGGLRALSGAIGKTEPEDYVMNTPVATIGIRGTGYDVNCQGDCTSNAPPSSSISPDIRLGDEEGLYSWVWAGSIAQENETGEHLLSAPGGSFIGGLDRVPIPLPTMPIIMQQIKVPRPDNVQVDAAELFDSETQDEAEPGVHVTVHDGDVELSSDDGVVSLGSSESGYLGDDEPVRLASVQGFQLVDATPSPVDFSVRLAETGKFSLLSTGATVFACSAD